MKKLVLNPDDYFLSGGVETAYIFIGKVLAYAAMNVGGKGLAITKHGIVRGYIEKTALISARDTWFATSSETVTQLFLDWKKKWNAREAELYALITTNDFDWRQAWSRLDEIKSEFWQESYAIEATDPFADEIEDMILESIKQAGLSKDLLHILMTPAQATRTQQADIDLGLVRDGRMSLEGYMRMYWYRNGTWNGGRLLTIEDVNSLLRDIPVNRDVVDFRQAHENVEEVLDKKIRSILHLLRILSLWREERKALMQEMCCCLDRVVEEASLDLSVDREVIRWSFPDEMDVLSSSTHAEETKARQMASVVTVDGKQSDVTVITGLEAERLLAPFIQGDMTADIRGTIASPGKVVGSVRVVLSANDFAQFQEGEVLVTTMTRPEFLPVMRQAAAIVTDEGGLISHAAIVARELKKPCIVGAKNATHVLKTGDIVEVNANHGLVRKI